MIAIIGVTSSGKSAAAEAIAESIGGEIISADSRAIYRDLHIGVRKPSKQMRERVTHHLLDVANLEDIVTMPFFRLLAEEAINLTRARSHTPLIVGGSRLYVNSLIAENEMHPLSEEEREEMQEEEIELIHARYHESETALPLNHYDRECLIQVLDENRVKRVIAYDPEITVIGMQRGEWEEVERSVRERLSVMLEMGLEEEVSRISSEHNRPASSINSIGYEEFDDYFAGVASLGEVTEKIVENTLSYARSQDAWVRSVPGIHWASSEEEAVEIAQNHSE